jgi:putative ABC transport system substrate-binding protein
MGDIQRRQFVIAVGALVAAPRIANAQPPQKKRRIGILTTAVPDGIFPRQMRLILARRGYRIGENVDVEWRLSEGKNERLPAFAEELVRLNPEVIIAHNTPAVAAIKPLTRTIPVVMITVSDPVENGFVDTLARPLGNITGTAWSGPEQIGKVLEILKQAVPGAVRVALLQNPKYPNWRLWKEQSDRAAGILGFTIEDFFVSQVDEVESVLKRIADARPHALCLGEEFTMFARQREIGAFVVQHKLISISTVVVHANNGGLFYYGPDLQAIFERSVDYVDRILRGSKPAELPVELPRKYELVFNARTAKAIGYQIPKPLLARVDRTIE